MDGFLQRDCPRCGIYLRVFSLYCLQIRTHKYDIGPTHNDRWLHATNDRSFIRCRRRWSPGEYNF